MKNMVALEPVDMVSAVVRAPRPAVNEDFRDVAGERGWRLCAHWHPAIDDPADGAGYWQAIAVHTEPHPDGVLWLQLDLPEMTGGGYPELWKRWLDLADMELAHLRARHRTSPGASAPQTDPGDHAGTTTKEDHHA